ncbi:MAG: hypothetical protein ACOY9Y_03495 [Bacillota bacterium]
MIITPQLRVSEAEPSPIVRDFGLYAEFLSNNRTALTPKNQYLAKQPLYQINQLMTTYVTAGNPNYDQPTRCSTCFTTWRWPGNCSARSSPKAAGLSCNQPSVIAFTKA